MLEFWNIFMISLSFLMLLFLIGLVIYALGISLYEFCMAHAYLFKKCCNKCCFCFNRPINTSVITPIDNSIIAPVDKSIIVPITKCNLIYVGKTPSGHNAYDAEPTDISSIKIVL